MRAMFVVLLAAILGPISLADATPSVARLQGLDQQARGEIRQVQYVREIFRPRMHGAIIDWCVSWARDCGDAGANNYCRRIGYDYAESWSIFQPGRTFVVGDDRFCNGDFCKGFSSVTCAR